VLLRPEYFQQWYNVLTVALLKFVKLCVPGVVFVSFASGAYLSSWHTLGNHSSFALLATVGSDLVGAAIFRLLSFFLLGDFEV